MYSKLPIFIIFNCSLHSSSVRTQTNLTKKYYGEEIENPIYKVDNLLFQYRDLMKNNQKLNIAISKNEQLPVLSMHSTIGSNNETINVNGNIINPKNTIKVSKCNSDQLEKEKQKINLNKSCKKINISLNLKTITFVYPLPNHRKKMRESKCQ